MDPAPIVIQAAVALPIILGVIVYSLASWERTRLHLYMVALLGTLVPWLGAFVVKGAVGDPWLRSRALDFEIMSSIAMPALFVVAMGLFARVRAFERSAALPIAVLSLPLVLSLAYWTDAYHHLFFLDRAAAVAGGRPETFAGPLWWAFQIWCGVCDAIGLAFCAKAAFSARNRRERKRAGMVFAAVSAPVIAHLFYVMEWQPFDYSLAPGALGATALFFASGVRRYGLFEPEPIVRSDVIEHLGDALVLTDPEGSVLDSNAAAEHALGVPRIALLGRSIGEALAELPLREDAERVGTRIAVLSPDEPHLVTELHCEDGRVFELIAGAVRAEGSHPAGRVVSLRDRSQQRRSERLLREQQKLESVGILAAGVAHEVNNPLAYVRANLVYLMELAAESEKSLPESLREAPELLAESLEGIERIGRIVESMLRFCRIPDEVHSSIDINQSVREVLRLAGLHRDCTVRVEEKLAVDLPPVQGSPERIVQVLFNLLLNGKQVLAGRPDGRVVIETAHEDPWVVVRVRDNGPGISDADRERIFDPFFTTRGPDEGTGLGLSIAVDIVREHQGQIEVESTPAKGACFTVRLPASSARTRPS